MTFTMTEGSVPASSVTQELYEVVVRLVYSDEFFDKKMAYLHAVRLIERLEDDGVVDRLVIKPNPVMPPPKRRRGK